MLTVDKSVEDELAVLLHQIVDVTEDATARGKAASAMPFSPIGLCQVPRGRRKRGVCPRGQALAECEGEGAA